MFRRQVLAKVGTVGLGVAALASGAGAAETSRRLPPNENVPSTTVNPFYQGQEVSTGEWITHRVGWVSSSEANVEDFLEKTEFRAWIDGEPVDDVASYWGEIYEEDGDWYVQWKCSTPPKPSGSYTFRTRFEYTEDLDGGSKRAGQVDDLTGSYVVSPGRGR